MGGRIGSNFIFVGLPFSILFYFEGNGMYNTHNWDENYLSSESEIKVGPGLLGLSETGIVGKGQHL